MLLLMLLFSQLSKNTCVPWVLRKSVSLESCSRRYLFRFLC